MIRNRFPKTTTAPKADYVVAVEVQNLHIAGRKVAKDDVLSLTAAQAAHWLSEGVLQPAPAPGHSGGTGA